MDSYSANEMIHGFRILGPVFEDRKPVDWRVAFSAYSKCDPLAQVEKEGYLSAFCFDADFVEYIRLTGSTGNFPGRCWAYWIWFDIDRENNLELALDDTIRLCNLLCDRYRIDATNVLFFFSGSKGFHLGLPLSVCNSPAPSTNFHTICRRFAERIAEAAMVKIDIAIYDKVRAFRAPNSRHQKTGLHKIVLEFADSQMMWIEDIQNLATAPRPFSIPKAAKPHEQAIEDWKRATDEVANQNVANNHPQLQRTALNRSTMDFLQHGAQEGERSKRLFSAATNLGEFGCSYELAWAFLSESALDSGLPPNEVRRQIECGLAHKKGK